MALGEYYCCFKRHQRLNMLKISLNMKGFLWTLQIWRLWNPPWKPSKPALKAHALRLCFDTREIELSWFHTISSPCAIVLLVCIKLKACVENDLGERVEDMHRPLLGFYNVQGGVVLPDGMMRLKQLADIVVPSDLELIYTISICGGRPLRSCHEISCSYTALIPLCFIAHSQ